MSALNYGWFAAVEEASPVAACEAGRAFSPKAMRNQPNTGKKASWGEDGPRCSDGPSIMQILYLENLN